MKKAITLLLFTSAISLFGASKPEETVRSFLLYQYGAEIPGIKELCQPSPDLWMLRGPDQPAKQQIIQGTQIKIGASGVFMENVDQDICIVEVREGRVDPQFNLALVYRMHQQLILQFLYESLLQNNESIAKLTTKPANVSFGGAPKASYGDMDVYAGVLALIPIVRASSPESDAQTKSITYRLPIGDEVFKVRVVRRDGTWKIDTDQKLTVPLKFFWR